MCLHGANLKPPAADETVPVDPIVIEAEIESALDAGGKDASDSDVAEEGKSADDSDQEESQGAEEAEGGENSDQVESDSEEVKEVGDVAPVDGAVVEPDTEAAVEPVAAETTGKGGKRRRQKGGKPQGPQRPPKISKKVCIF